MLNSIDLNQDTLDKKMQYRVFVFANLKPSQIDYKIIPLSRSGMVEKVIILRKTPLLINSEKIICLSLPWHLRIRPIYWFFTFIYGIHQIRKHKTNIILSYNIFPHGLNAYLASIFLKQKAIFSEINEDTINYSQKLVFKFIVKKILDNASLICTPGSNTTKFWNLLGYNNTTQLHSTIDIHKFKPNKLVQKEYDFIYIGTLDTNKRPQIIIDAYNRLLKDDQNLRLCIIGFGPLEFAIKQKIKALKIEKNISFISTNDVLGYINKSKVFVMASLSEGLPCAMMEAMACELVVIVPPVGDISDVVIHGENGYLHDNTINDLSYFMKEAITNYYKLDALRNEARSTIEKNHSYSSATEKWNYVFNNIDEFN